MSLEVASIIDTLQHDDWRDSVGFSEDIDAANSAIWKAEAAGDERGIQEHLRDWLRHHQPCLFGKAASARDLISFCILTQDDLRKPDAHIRDKIQDARLRWLAAADTGAKSAFIILAVSQKIALAIPSPAMKELALRLAFLYLETEVREDHVHLDEIFLTMPRRGGDVVWKWDVGVNYFATQGDKRWWHDHRVPGGLAFSMNSVGHMVKSAQLAEAEDLSSGALGLPVEEIPVSKITSLGRALEHAMRTIGSAHETPWGKATQLLPLSESANLAQCPITLTRDLEGKNHCEYEGYYHTDFSIPNQYFVADPARPNEQQAYSLDFTYLFHDSVENPAHRTMAKGRRVKTDTVDADTLSDVLKAQKEGKATEEEVLLEDCPLLREARARYGNAGH